MRGQCHLMVAAISSECLYVDGKCLNFVPNSNDQYVREIVGRVLVRCHLRPCCQWPPVVMSSATMWQCH